jgi:hypothetical protein
MYGKKYSSAYKSSIGFLIFVKFLDNTWPYGSNGTANLINKTIPGFHGFCVPVLKDGSALTDLSSKSDKQS